MNTPRFARLLIVTFATLGLTFPFHAAESGAKKLKAATTESDSSRSTKSGRIDLNTADLAALESLPGVGPVTARAIVASRPFATVDDLENVPGIGPVKMQELKKLVTVSMASTRKESLASRGAEKSKTDAAAAKERPSSSTQVPSTSQGRIDLNTATRQQLESLPDIGPVKAQAIIDARPFSSIEDVMRVKGIKEGTFEVIKDKITVR